MREWNPFSAKQWIAWLGATLIAAVACTSFVYANFQTQKDADKTESRIEERLTRIENKQDQTLYFLRNGSR